MWKQFYRAGLISFFIMFNSSFSSAEVIFVNKQASGNNDGTSWSNAFTTIDAALQSAVPGESELWVAAGTYTPAVNGDRTRLPVNVPLYGGFSGNESSREKRDPAANVTTIAGLPEVVHIFVARGFGAGLFIIDGFRFFQGGQGTHDFLDEPIGGGGALRIEDTTVIVRQCRFENNATPPFIEPRTINGGAIYCYNSTLEVTKCEFIGNYCRDLDLWPTNTTGGWGGSGGAISAESSSLLIQQSKFSANRAGRGAPTDVFIPGVQPPGGRGGSGGAVYMYQCERIIRNCLFTGNESGPGGSGNPPGVCGNGGAIAGTNNIGTSGTLMNCTFVGNETAQAYGDVGEGGAWFGYSWYTSISNCIFADNYPGHLAAEAASLSPHYCNLVGENNFQNGNIDADPLFVSGENYRLMKTSPCINTGNPDFIPAEGELDFGGRPRVFADRVDMGAYEFGWGDSNSDGEINLVDLAALWANDCVTGPLQTATPPVSPSCTAFDYDWDGDVDTEDLAKWQHFFSR